MAFLVQQVGLKPPDSIVKLFQSGAIPEEELVGFFSWLDSVVKVGSDNKNKEISTKDLLEQFFSSSRVIELAARVKATQSLEANSNVSEKKGKSLLSYLKLDKPIVFFDLETAGVEGEQRYKIVEISMVKYYPDGKEEAFTQRINPEVPIQKKAEEIHHISDLAVKDCPNFRQVAPAIKAFFNDCHLGGFNIINFDIIGLQKEFQSIGEKFSIKGKAIIDPMYIYHDHVPYKEGETRTLTDAYKYYCGKKLEDAHQAKADILATIEVLLGQYDKYEDMPKDVYKLSKYCQEKHYDIDEFVDPEGKFVWDNGEVTFHFGKKHYGKKLRDVVEIDKGYLFWMLKEKPKGEDDFSSEIKAIIRGALDGKYPEPPETKGEN